MIIRRLAIFASITAIVLLWIRWIDIDFYNALMAQIHAPQRIGTMPTLGFLSLIMVSTVMVGTFVALLRLLTRPHPAMQAWTEDTAWSLRRAMVDHHGTGRLSVRIHRYVTGHYRYIRMGKVIDQMCAMHPVLDQILSEHIRRDLCQTAFIEDDHYNPRLHRDVLERAAYLRPGMIFDSGIELNPLYQDCLSEALGFTMTAGGFVLRETPTSAYQRVQDRLFVAAANVIQNAYTGQATPARKKLLIEARSAADAGFTTPSGLSKPKAIAAYAMAETSAIVSDVVSTTPLEAVL